MFITFLKLFWFVSLCTGFAPEICIIVYIMGLLGLLKED